MYSFPTVFPQDAADALHGMLLGSIPWDKNLAAQSAWNLQGYATGQVLRTPSSVQLGVTNEDLVRALDPKSKGAFDWSQLVPPLTGLLSSVLSGLLGPGGSFGGMMIPRTVPSSKK